MSNRYVIAYETPDYVKEVISKAYGRSVGRELPADWLHLSFTFPFYLNDGYGEEWLQKAVASMSFVEIGAWVTKIDYFEQMKKKILHIEVEPRNELVAIYKRLIPILRAGVNYDMTVFDGEEKPGYAPHLTLDYDFDGDQYTLMALRQEKIEAYFDIAKLSVIRI